MGPSILQRLVVHYLVLVGVGGHYDSHAVEVATSIEVPMVRSAHDRYQHRLLFRQANSQEVPLLQSLILA